MLTPMLMPIGRPVPALPDGRPQDSRAPPDAPRLTLPASQYSLRPGPLNLSTRSDVR
jgi:hypothetical protein